MPPTKLAVEEATTVQIGNDHLPLVEVRGTGDLLLDVQFKNASDSIRSIPKDALRLLRTQKLPIPSPRVLFRVKLDTLTKHSEYFRILLKPQFAEGLAVAERLASLAQSKEDPATVEASRLPRVKIVDEDIGKTIGRELVFEDLMRVLHGIEPLSHQTSTLYISILVLMGDKYNVTSFISRHMQKSLLNHRYPSGEEALRQKILILYHIEQGARFFGATKELIVRGSLRWSGVEQNTSEFKTIWWDLPYGIEAELAFRRSCLLRTIASIQNQFLSLYSSRERQCQLGYDSSSSCDSFQLGEMVKFLTRKGLLSLVPFQAVSPDDQDYIWPEAYNGDVESLIGVLRQCPAYQIDKNHSHCGLRSKLLPALDYIKSCIDSGLGIKLTRSKSGPLFDSWLPSNSSAVKKPFYVGSVDGEDVDVTGEKLKRFEFSSAKRAGFGGAATDLVEKSPRALFTAQLWNWITEPESGTKTSFVN